MLALESSGFMFMLELKYKGNFIKKQFCISFQYAARTKTRTLTVYAQMSAKQLKNLRHEDQQPPSDTDTEFTINRTMTTGFERLGNAAGHIFKPMLASKSI